VLQRSAACCTGPWPPLQKPVTGATKEVPATCGGGFCYKRQRRLLHAVVASATSGGGLFYKRWLLLLHSMLATASSGGSSSYILQWAAATCGDGGCYNRRRRRWLLHASATAATIGVGGCYMRWQRLLQSAVEAAT
jgi:hypothetical protein